MTEDDATLSLALEPCRKGLEEAWEQGRRRKARFEVSEVTFGIETVLRKGTEASGGVRWCVPQAGATRKKDAGASQTLMLTVTPGLDDEDGYRSYRSVLNAHADQPRPGR